MAQFIPTQTQAFLLYGGGSVIGDVSLTLASFKDINGNLLTMQGTEMTGTIEPNSGANEEQIIFTGVTQNANGTATLTGVSSVGFASPYTVTSGLLKSHAGNTTFVLSDTAYLYSKYAVLENTQTFTGTDTFNIAPIIPTVGSGQTTQAASVGYVNSISIAGAPKASTTVFGITELTTAPAIASVPLAVGDNDPRMAYVTASESLALAAVGQGNIDNTNFYVSQRGAQNGSESYALTTGSSTVYALTLAPVPTGYVTGERIYFKTNVASGTAPTINKNSLGAKSLYKQSTTGTTPLAIGDMGTNQMNVAEYDGVAYQLLSPVAGTTKGQPYKYTGAITTDTAVACVNGTDTNIGSIAVPALGANDIMYVDAVLSYPTGSPVTTNVGFKAGANLLMSYSKANDSGDTVTLSFILAQRNSTSAQYNSLNSFGATNGLVISQGATAVNLASAFTLNLFVNTNTTSNATVRYMIVRQMTNI